MAKQLNVNLAFTADTAKAKAQLKDLQRDLTNLINNNAGKNLNSFNFTNEIKDATLAVATLKRSLEEATNINTGKLDLSRFNQSLKQSGYNIKSLRDNLTALGPEGTKAFLSLTQSISMAEVPIRRSNALLKEFGITLKNTARWQISSGILHGFLGTIQHAYGYAKDLNESLNNIRIVTGQNTEQMAKFASEANKAAQALNTTTTEYTNASLIYYQQGLSDEEVRKRTDVTVKMANVSRQSAEEVSDQLTAIWNNFYDGSKSLEYYADTITALGAATASSSEEISEGLEKFASVADTVGLSYEYATAALATVTATTRQSADIVGNAFKTLFARIEGLNLGETLDDGTTLNKYSEALAAVGINIKDTNGDLKDMDQILDELGSKWQTLGKDQQVALAQTVAGVRQYTQLIALMDNWDFFGENLEVARDATGTLQEQADIYAESWEAARDRVKAASEEIYGQLLNDDFFIDLNNTLAKTLNLISSVIDGLGGLPGVILLLGSVATKVFQSQIAQGLERWTYNLISATEAGRQRYNQVRQESIEALKSWSSDSGLNTVTKMTRAFESQAKIQETLIRNANKLTEEQKGIVQILSDQHSLLMQNVLEREKEAEEAEKVLNKESQNLSIIQSRQVALNIQDNYKNRKTIEGYKRDSDTGEVSYVKPGTRKSFNIEQEGGLQNFLQKQVQLYIDLRQEAQLYQGIVENIFSTPIKNMGIEEALDLVKEKIKLVEQEFTTSGEKAEEFLGQKGVEALNKLKIATETEGITIEQLDNSLNHFIVALIEVSGDANQVEEHLKKLGFNTEGYNEAVRIAIEENISFADALRKVEKAGEHTSQTIEQMASSVVTSMSTKIAKASHFVTTFGMTLSSIRGLVNTWNNEDMSFGEKIIQSLITLGMILPSITSLINEDAFAKVANVIATKLLGAANLGLATTETVATGTTITLEAALAGLLAITGTIILALGALVAVGWLLVNAFKEIKANSPEGKLEKANKAAQELSDSFNTLKSRTDELSSSFDQYDKVVETLEQCTMGTQEWKDALKDVNDQVIEMLDKYPDLLEFVQRNENGQLYFNQDDIDKVVEKANKASQVAQYASIQGRLNAERASIGVTSQGASEVEEFISLIEAKATNRDALSDLMYDFYELGDLTEKEFKQRLLLIGIFDDEADELLKFKDSIKEESDAFEKFFLKQQNANELIVRENLDANVYGEEVVKIVAKSWDELVQEEKARLDEDLWGEKGIAQINGANEAAIKVFDEYAKAAKLQNVYLKDTAGADYQRTFKYLDEATGEEKEVSLEMMKTTVATAKALEQLGVSAEKVSELLSKIGELPETESKALLSFLNNGNFNALTETEFAEFEKEINQYPDAIAYLESVTGKSIEELAETTGQDTDELIESFDKSRENYSKVVENYTKTMYETSRTAFEKLDLNSLSAEAQVSVAKLFNDIFVRYGQKGVDSLNQVLKSLKPEEIDKFIEATQGIDWQNTSVEDFKDKLKEVGINTNLSNEELSSFVVSMRGVSPVARDAAERFTELQSILEKLADGSTISEEDYQALGGDLYESFFLKMADGTYKLTTDASTFYDIVNQKSIQGFEDTINRINNLQSSGYSQEDLENTAGTDNSKLSAQIDFLQAIGNYDELIANVTDAKTSENLQAIANAVKENADQWELLDTILEDNQEQLASTAMSLSELHSMLDDERISTEAFTKAAMAMDASLDIKNLDAEELADYTLYLQNASDTMEGFNKEMSKDEARIVAKSIMKMNDAIQELSDNWEDWSSILQESNEGSEEYKDAMLGMIKSVADLLDINSEFVSDDFIIQHLEEIQKAAEGDAEAIDNLKLALSEDIIARIILDNADFISSADEVKSLYDTLVASIPDIDVGVTLSGESDFANALNSLVEATGMTVDQVNALCDSLGFEVKYSNEEVPTSYKVPVTQTHHRRENIKYDDYNNPIEWDDTESVKTDFIENDGSFAAFAIATNGTAPKISGVTKKATGSVNNFSSANKGGPKASSSSGSPKKADKKDKIDDVADRYYDINNAISAVNEELEKQEQLEKQLSSLQNHYAGKTLIDSLKQENTLIKNKNGLLEKQFTNYQKVYELQSQELADLKAQIGGEWEGNMLQNYTELFQANLDAYNSAIDTYNAMSAEQQEESGKQMIEDAKTAYDEYKDALERYQDLYYNEMYDTENKLAELRQQQLENQIKIIENNLKGWEIEVDLKLDKTDLERDLNNFFNEVQQDFRKIYKNISIDSTFDTKNFNTYLTDVETRMSQIRDVEAEIDKMNRSKGADGKIQLSDDMMFGSIEEAQDKLKELQKELTSTGKNLQDLYEQVWDNYIDGLDQAKDNFEDLNKEFKHLTNELEYEKELIELVYGDKAFDLMNKYYTTQQRSIENQIASTRTQAEFWEDQFNKAYQMNRDKHNVELEDMSTWTEDMRKAYDEMISSQEQLNDLVIEGIKNVRDEYLNNVAKTFSDMDKALWGMDFTDVKEDWDFIQKKADEYLDDVEGAYQIQTLANKIDNSIAEANSLKAQQKLAALRDDEINFLREKKNLTQDDIDIAEARYQIALKELALEDAQNNKTSMKLTRDTSGNWTYQYVADEEDVQNKQQELLDAYNELYKIADDAYAHAMELAMNTYEEFREKMQEIAEDTTLSEEEKYLKIQELQDLYLPEINAAVENAGLYEQETLMAGAAVFAEVCEQDAEAYLTLTDLQKTLVDEVRDQHLEDYEEIRAAILNDYDEIGIKAQETFEEMNLNSQTATADIIGQWDTNPKTGSVKGAMQDAFDNIVKYTQNFELELMRLEQVSGKVILDKGGVVDDINQVGLKTDEVAYKTNLLADTASANLSTLRGFVNEVEDAWNGVISKIEKAISALQQYLSMMGSPVGTSSVNLNSDWIGEYAKKIKEYTDNNSSSNAGTPTGGDNAKNKNEDSEKNNSKKSDFYSDLERTSIFAPWDTSTRDKIQYMIDNAQQPSNNEAWTDWMHKGNTQSNSTKKYREDLGLTLTDEEYEEFLKHQTQNDPNYFAEWFATGGYTGEWGDTSGKLAVLHEKELVLNAQDTENMLDAVKAVRSISGLNDSISETIAKSISGLVAAAFGINTNNINSAGGDNTSNVYNITAEFPNADDVQTIRDAILSLPNLASQYIYES